jgi:hypothetical protein
LCNPLQGLLYVLLIEDDPFTLFWIHWHYP